MVYVTNSLVDLLLQRCIGQVHRDKWREGCQVVEVSHLFRYLLGGSFISILLDVSEVENEVRLWEDYNIVSPQKER